MIASTEKEFQLHALVNWFISEIDLFEFEENGWYGHIVGEFEDGDSGQLKNCPFPELLREIFKENQGFSPRS